MLILQKEFEERDKFGKNKKEIKAFYGKVLSFIRFYDLDLWHDILIEIF